MSRIPIFVCILVLATAVLCEDPPSTKAPEHQKQEHPKQTGSAGNPPEQHHKMPKLSDGPENKQQPQQQLPNFNQN
ncbi:jg9095 [Pararge aegeria aegeria]|uniref:Jg9095 protein n=1 Tax=Pararge aegeria aegeria TaxID=348720 RepID=A0A8S4RWM3_9NEOP|nr:jg9095 [Pararge aegeria aegeria]